VTLPCGLSNLAWNGTKHQGRKPAPSCDSRGACAQRPGKKPAAEAASTCSSHSPECAACGGRYVHPSSIFQYKTLSPGAPRGSAPGNVHGPEGGKMQEQARIRTRRSARPHARHHWACHKAARRATAMDWRKRRMKKRVHLRILRSVRRQAQRGRSRCADAGSKQEFLRGPQADWRAWTFTLQ